MKKKLILFIATVLMLVFSTVAQDVTSHLGPIEIIEPHFVAQNYEWKGDRISFGNMFGVRLESENATNFEVEITGRSPNPFFSLQECDELDCYVGGELQNIYIYINSLTAEANDNYYEFLAFLGEGLRFTSYNDGGEWIDSEPIFTTDYITDPVILTYLENLKNQASGVEDLLREPDPAADLVHRFGDSLKVSAEVSEVAVFNEKGEKLMHVTDPQGEVSISDLESGIYFAAAKTPTGLSKTLKFRK